MSSSSIFTLSEPSIAVCTLADSDYYYGAGALANSLHKTGFRGTFWIGYRGPLPSWASGRERFNAADGLELRFLRINSEWNLAFEKPALMLRILDEAPHAEGVIYFDADIVVRAPWHFFSEWIDAGVALCLDACYPIVPAGHPWRRAWSRFGESAGFSDQRQLDFYFNSGFLGMRREHAAIAQTWRTLIEAFASIGNKRLAAIKYGSRADPFCVPDQDLLNAAAALTAVPISPIGREAMDFIPAGYVMSHAIATPKPWKRRYLRLAFSGSPPQRADKEYWANVDGPIRLFSSRARRTRQLNIKIAAALGRLYRRY